MPLLTFWKSAAETVAQLTVEQVVSNAGDGVLKDSSTCSAELREYLSGIPSDKIPVRSPKSFLALGCMDLPFAFAIPVEVMSSVVDALNTTTKDEGQTYWHITLLSNTLANMQFSCPRGQTYSRSTNTGCR